MKSLNSDIWALGISAVIIITFSSLLYQDFTQRMSTAHAQQIGSITYKKRVAQRKYAGQVIWEDVEKNIPVYNNDSIRTSDNSEAVIHLKDGTAIELADNSLILLAVAKNAININFTNGTIYAKRTGAAGGHVNILSKDTTVSIEKSNIRLSKTENKELNLSVSDGTAKLKTSREAKTIGKDQEATVSRDSRIGKIVEQRFKLISPQPNQHLVTAEHSLPVEFRWSALGAGASAFLEISESGTFGKTVVSRKITGDSSSASLGDGTYYWRLRAVEGGGSASEVRRLTVIRENPVSLLSPANGREIRSAGKNPIITFRWLPGVAAVGYRIEVSGDRSFSRMVYAGDTALTELAIDSIGPGSYFWRVISQLQIGGTRYRTTSAVNAFAIVRQSALGPPALIFPPDGKKVGAAMMRKSGLVFSWKADEPAARFTFQLSRNNRFAPSILSIPVSGNFFTLVRELPDGQYYWRIMATLAGASPAVSPMRTFTILKGGSIVLKTPVRGAALNVKEGEKSSSVAFSWDTAGVAGTSVLELARTRGFLPVHAQRQTGNTAITIADIEPGSYFWRIRLLDSDRSEIAASEIGQFMVKSTAASEEKKTAIAGKPVLIVESSVAKSDILMNGRLMGQNRVTITAEPDERIVIEVRTRGYYSFLREFRLKSGEKRNLYARLLKLKDEPRIRWKESLKSPVCAQPVFAGDLLIITTNNGLVHGMLKNGKRLWSADCGSGFDSTPVVHRSRVYVVTRNSKLFSLNLADGVKNWDASIPGPLLFGSRPLLHEDKIFIATSLGIIQVFDLNGKELWKKDLEGEIYSSMEYDSNTLFVCSANHMIYALDAADGGEKWSMLADSRIVASSPRIYRGILYVGCYSGSFYAIETARGRKLWSFKASKPVMSNPNFSPDMVYFGANDGFLYALKIATGGLVWKFDAREKILAESCIANDLLYMASGKTVYALDPATGALSWKQEFGSRVKTAPTAVGNDIYVGLDNGDVLSLRSDLTVK